MRWKLNKKQHLHLDVWVMITRISNLGFRYEATFMCVPPTRAITRDERLQEVLLHNPTYITVTCLYIGADRSGP